MADGNGVLSMSEALATPRREARTGQSFKLNRDRIAHITLEWASPDSWSPRQIATFTQALEHWASDDAPRLIILTGERIFRDSAASPSTIVREAMDRILSAIAEHPVPIAAAIPGGASGAGLELALSCAARVCDPGAIFSLSGIKGARLPRGASLRTLIHLVGIEAAATLVALSREWTEGEAVDKGLIDAVAQDPVAGASALAARLPDILAGRTHALDAHDIQARFFSVRCDLRRATPDQVAPVSAARAMEAAVQLRPRRVAAEVDRIADQLANSDQGAALRYAQAGALALHANKEVDGIDLSALAARLRWPMVREAIHLIDEGASPAQVDRCLQTYGFANGPFAASDQSGLAAVFTSRDEALPSDADWVHYSPTVDLMTDCGRVGRDSAGWYQPAAESAVRFDPRVNKLLQTSALSQRLVRAPIADDAVIDRCLAAAVNGAFERVDDDRRLTVELIDAVWVARLGYPAWKGGPIYSARRTGLGDIVETIKSLPRNTIGAISGALLSSAGLSTDHPGVSKTA